MLRRERSKTEEEREKQNKKRNQLMYVLHVIKITLQISMTRKTLFTLLAMLRNVEREELNVLKFFHLCVAASH